MKRWEDIRKPVHHLIDESNDPERNFYKEYSVIDGDTVSHFLILEVAGDVEKARDLRYTIEKLEYPGLGMSAILPLAVMEEAAITTELH